MDTENDLHALLVAVNGEKGRGLEMKKIGNQMGSQKD